MKRGTPDHPKTRALAARLGLRRFEIVGLLESLWHFTAGYAKRGDVGRFTDAEIASHLEWRGEPGEMIAALVEARWLDRCPCHRLRVHHWKDHADQTVSRSDDVKKRGFLECYDREDLPILVTTSVSVSPASQSVPLPLPLPEPRPVPEPEPVPCAASADGGSQSLDPSLPPIEAYGAQIVDEWHKARGSDFPQPSNRDFQQLCDWHGSGIPLRVVVRGIKDCIETMRRRGDKPAGKTLAYYNSAVRHAHGQWHKALA